MPQILLIKNLAQSVTPVKRAELFRFFFDPQTALVFMTDSELSAPQSIRP